jgi:methylsterol monooxygenase
MSKSTAMQLLDNYFPFVASHLQTMNATETHNALYGGMELSQLSWMERTWASYYIWMGNPILATGLLSFVLHEVSGRALNRSRCCGESTTATFVLKFVADMVPGRLLWSSSS